MAHTGWCRFGFRPPNLRLLMQRLGTSTVIVYQKSIANHVSKRGTIESVMHPACPRTASWHTPYARPASQPCVQMLEIHRPNETSGLGRKPRSHR